MWRYGDDFIDNCTATNYSAGAELYMQVVRLAILALLTNWRCHHCRGDDSLCKVRNMVTLQGVGASYWKALYVAYTDDTFEVRLLDLQSASSMACCDLS